MLQSRTRKGKAAATNTTVDPFLRKGVAFHCDSDYGKTLIKEFGKKWVSDAVYYHLNGNAGHVISTVMRKSRAPNAFTHLLCIKRNTRS